MIGSALDYIISPTAFANEGAVTFGQQPGNQGVVADVADHHFAGSYRLPETLREIVEDDELLAREET